MLSTGFEFFSYQFHDESLPGNHQLLLRDANFLLSTLNKVTLKVMVNQVKVNHFLKFLCTVKSECYTNIKRNLNIQKVSYKYGYIQKITFVMKITC